MKVSKSFTLWCHETGRTGSVLVGSSIREFLAWYENKYQNNMEHKGKISINGKKWDCEVIEGVRYIDGKTVDEFMETLSPEDLVCLAKIGKLIVDREDISPQEAMNEFHQAKNN